MIRIELTEEQAGMLLCVLDTLYDQGEILYEISEEDGFEYEDITEEEDLFICGFMDDLEEALEEAYEDECPCCCCPFDEED